MKYFVIEGIDTCGKSTQHRILKEKLNGVNLSDIEKKMCLDSVKLDSKKTDSMNLDSAILDSNSTDFSHLQNQYIFINEPGSTHFGNAMREMLLSNNLNLSNRTRFLLFLAQRADIFEKIATLQHSQNYIESKKHFIIADRSLISGIAYASLELENLELLKQDYKQNHNFIESKNLESLFKMNLFATQNILPEKIVFLEISKDELEKRMSQKALDSIEKNGINYLLLVQENMQKILDFIMNYAKNNGYLIPQILNINASLDKNLIHQKIYNFFFNT